MKKRFLNVLIAGVLGTCVLAACQKAPEASVDSDIYHAKSSLEGEVENIASDEAYQNAADTNGPEQSEYYESLVGTEKNGDKADRKPGYSGDPDGQGAGGV